MFKLEKNVIDYYEFTYNDIKYYILEGVFTQNGKAVGFGSEYDARIYFTDREMPNERLQIGFEYAKEHYLGDDLSIICLALDRMIEVDGDRLTIDEFLDLNHYNRDENDRLSEKDLKGLFALKLGESIFIHLSVVERIT
jgi:hypothetical protein